MRANLTIGILALASSFFMVDSLAAQGRLKPFTSGDGRIHSAPTLQVIEMDLHPGQVQTINLWPRYHTVLEFPFPVARVDGGDSDVFAPDIVGNKLTLKAIDVDVVETSMTIILGDAKQTLIPFLIRADSTQPMAYVVRFTDPVEKHLNLAEAEIAKTLNATVGTQVTKLSEENIRQRLLHSGGSITIQKSASVGVHGGKITLTAEQAEQMPGPDGRPRLYLRYRISNGGFKAVDDAQVVARVSTKRRHWLFFTKTTHREVTEVEEIRTAGVVPVQGAVRGLMIIDGLELKANQALHLEMISDGGKRHIRVDRVLVGEQ